MTKFRTNVSRDTAMAGALRRAGWRVFTIWECQVAPARLARLVRDITRAHR
jgi:G:T-mismatch repair DNA endonuclease (very short patch repair protein)